MNQTENAKRCLYCDQWILSKVFGRLTLKENSPVKKQCIEGGKIVTADDLGCGNFKSQEFFYCLKHNHRISGKVCYKRREEDKCAKTCRQFHKFIKHIYPQRRLNIKYI